LSTPGPTSSVGKNHANRNVGRSDRESYSVFRWIEPPPRHLPGSLGGAIVPFENLRFVMVLRHRSHRRRRPGDPRRHIPRMSCENHAIPVLRCLSESTLVLKCADHKSPCACRPMATAQCAATKRHHPPAAPVFFPAQPRSRRAPGRPNQTAQPPQNVKLGQPQIRMSRHSKRRESKAGSKVGILKRGDAGGHATVTPRQNAQRPQISR